MNKNTKFESSAKTPFLVFSWVYTSNARYRLRREIRVPQGPPGPDVSRDPNCGLQCGKTGPPRTSAQRKIGQTRKIIIFLYFSWVSTSNARYRLRREIRVPQGPLGPDVSRNPNCGLQCGKTEPPAQLSPAKNWTNTKKI